jgi:8-hydroxy-5-deazaflavin:NADPH oxidoreductase
MGETVGIIGAGRIGQAVAKQALRAGRSVVISNNRGVDALKPLIQELGAKARAGTVQEAAGQSTVVLAVPWENVEEVLESLPPWDGRILIDATNAALMPDFRVPDLGGKASSQVIADLAPGARVVKGFNTLLAAILASDARVAGGQRVLFFSGDDPDAKQAFHRLITDAGFAGIDLGRLAASKVQQFPGGPLAAINLVQFP